MNGIIIPQPNETSIDDLVNTANSLEYMSRYFRKLVWVIFMKRDNKLDDKLIRELEDLRMYIPPKMRPTQHKIVTKYQDRIFESLTKE